MKPMVCGAIIYNPQITAIEGADAEGLRIYSINILGIYVTPVCDGIPNLLNASLRM